MDSPLLSFFLLLLLSFTSPSSIKTEPDHTKSARDLDILIRNYTLNTFANNPFIKTGTLQIVKLPKNLSGIKVNAARFRCGSLRRYGAKLNEFNLGINVIVHPCIERVILVTQRLDKSWSFVFYDNYELHGHKLVSPVIGLSAYNYSSLEKDQSELKIMQVSENPILIDFSNIIEINPDSKPGLIPLCASFEGDGKVTLSEMRANSHECVATRNGHFGLVVESPLVPWTKIKESGKWKMRRAIGTACGALIGALLLGLLMVAMLVRVKKRSRLMEEIERRAYEEEALQVSMVGHVRAHNAPRTRTTSPTIEYLYRPNSIPQ